MLLVLVGEDSLDFVFLDKGILEQAEVERSRSTRSTASSIKSNLILPCSTASGRYR